MSTRAHIKVTEGQESVYIYHHCDGYPDGVGIDVENCLESIGFFDKSQTQDLGTVVSNICEIDDGYRVDEGIHGDEEYLYVVDINERLLNVYFIPDFDMPEDEIIQEKNLVEI